MHAQGDCLRITRGIAIVGQVSSRCGQPTACRSVAQAPTERDNFVYWKTNGKINNDLHSTHIHARARTVEPWALPCGGSEELGISLHWHYKCCAPPCAQVQALIPQPCLYSCFGFWFIMLPHR